MSVVNQRDVYYKNEICWINWLFSECAHTDDLIAIRLHYLIKLIASSVESAVTQPVVDIYKNKYN